jgi:hypothetical protein
LNIAAGTLAAARAGGDDVGYAMGPSNVPPARAPRVTPNAAETPQVRVILLERLAHYAVRVTVLRNSDAGAHVPQ